MTEIELRATSASIRANKAIADHLEKIDWEQRRYELTKAAMQGYLASSMSTTVKHLAESSVIMADTVIDELKKTKKEDS